MEEQLCSSKIIWCALSPSSWELFGGPWSGRRERRIPTGPRGCWIWQWGRPPIWTARRCFPWHRSLWPLSCRCRGWIRTWPSTLRAASFCRRATTARPATARWPTCARARPGPSPRPTATSFPTMRSATRNLRLFLRRRQNSGNSPRKTAQLGV